MKNALVLGGNGFIGYHLVHELMHHGWQVTVYDRTAENRFLDWDPAPVYVRGELGNRELVRECLHQADTVFHLAYTTIPKTSNDDPAYDVESNVKTSVDLLTECVGARIQRFLFISSGGTVYGIPKQLPIPEDHPTQPICSYGITKLMIERYLHLFSHLHGLSYAVLRPANPYGEQQNILGEQGAVSVFLGRIAARKPVVVWGDGSVTRDYFHVGDLARACVMAAESKEPELLLNIGSGRGLSLNELLATIRSTLQVDFEVEYLARRPFDVPELVLDTRRAQRILGWNPEVPLEEGLRRTWLWIQQQLPADSSP